MRIRAYHHDGSTTTLASAFKLRFSESVNGSPWHRMAGSFGAPVEVALSLQSLGIRDWIAFETAPGQARMLVRADDVHVNISEGPDVECTVQFKGVGFLDAARANDVVASPGVRSAVDSTLFQYDDWADNIIVPYTKTFSGGDLGRFLQAFTRTLIRMQLPPQLASVGLGQLIYIQHALGADFGSSEHIGANRIMDPVRGMSISGIRSLLKTRGKVVELLTGTFAPSQTLIELFPSLEPVPSLGIGAQPPTHSGPYGTFAYSVEGGGQGLPAPVLGNYLTVVYRLRPWRTQSLAQAIKIGRAPSSNVSAEPEVFQTLEAFPDDPYSFDKVTWPTNPRVLAAPLGFDGSVSNSRIVNAATTWLQALGSGEELQVMGELGLPVTDNYTGMARDGLRLAASIWPFLPSPGAAKGKVRRQDILEFTKRVAAQVMQFYAPDADLFKGSIPLGLDLSVRAGEVYRVPLTRTGRLFEFYAESVEHDVTCDANGVASGTTTITYSRGAWADEGDKRTASVYVQPTMSAAEQQPAAGGRHWGLVFGGEQKPCTVNWPFVITDAKVQPDPDVKVKKVVTIGRGNFYRTPEQIARLTEALAVETRIEVPVKAEQRLFVFGDTEPTSNEIESFKVGYSLDKALPAIGRSATVGIDIKAGAYAIDAPKGGWPVVAATGERHGNPRPSLEDMGSELGFALRDPADITCVVLHSPGARSLAWAARNTAIQTFIGNYGQAQLAAQILPPNAQSAARAAAVGAHFVIDRKGCIWQLQDALRLCNHTAWGGTGWVNNHSIGIELALPTALHKRPRSAEDIEAARAKGYEYPDPNPVELTGPDVDCRYGGSFPEGGLVTGEIVKSSLSRSATLTVTDTQPSRAQYRALGALLTTIKLACPNFQPVWQGAGDEEFHWVARKQDGKELPSGIWIHSCLDDSRTECLSVNRARVLAYTAPSVDLTPQARAVGDKQ